MGVDEGGEVGFGGGMEGACRDWRVCPFWGYASGVEGSEDFGGREGRFDERGAVDFGVCCCSIAAGVALDY